MHNQKPVYKPTLDELKKFNQQYGVGLVKAKLILEKTQGNFEEAWKLLIKEAKEKNQ